MKDQIRQLQEEIIKLAEENEQATREKCAQVLLAASGLELLKQRIQGKREN